jgi:hypothetical protein
VAADMELAVALENALTKQTVTIDRFFFDWRGGALRSPTEAYDGEDFAPLRSLLGRYRPVDGATDHPYWSDSVPCSMHIDEVETIWERIDREDDWSMLEAKVAAVRRMGDAFGRNA